MFNFPDIVNKKDVKNATTYKITALSKSCAMFTGFHNRYLQTFVKKGKTMLSEKTTFTFGVVTYNLG